MMGSTAFRSAATSAYAVSLTKRTLSNNDLLERRWRFGWQRGNGEKGRKEPAKYAPKYSDERPLSGACSRRVEKSIVVAAVYELCAHFWRALEQRAHGDISLVNTGNCVNVIISCEHYPRCGLTVEAPLFAPFRASLCPFLCSRIRFSAN